MTSVLGKLLRQVAELLEFRRSDAWWCTRGGKRSPHSPRPYIRVHLWPDIFFL